ncbi:MAG: PepSY-associated TM helix domain-containing protein [Planctomycetota bacterium]
MSRPKTEAPKRAYRLHGWLGVHLGLVLFLICFSGTVATFGYELDLWANPGLASGATSQPVDLAAVYDATASAHPAGHVIYVAEPAIAGAPATALVSYGAADLRTVAVDPADGRVRDTAFLSIQRFFRQFHKKLLLGTLLPLVQGTTIVGLFSIVLLVATVTALLFYRRWWRGLFGLSWSRGLRVGLSDLHRFAGSWSLVLAVLWSITGAWYLIDAERRLLSAEPAPAATTTPTTPGSNAPRPQFRDYLAAAHRVMPDLRVQRVRLPESTRGTVIVMGHAPSLLARKNACRVRLDATTAEVLSTRHIDDLSAYDRINESVDVLHYGTCGGRITKWIWFVGGLLLCAGILAGPWLWSFRVHRSPAARVPCVSRLSLLLTAAILAATLVASVGTIVRWSRPSYAVPTASATVELERYRCQVNRFDRATGSVGVGVRIGHEHGLPAVKGLACRGSVDRDWVPLTAVTPYAYAGQIDAAPTEATPLSVAADMADGTRVQTSVTRADFAAFSPLDSLEPDPPPRVPGRAWLAIFGFLAVSLGVCVMWLRLQLRARAAGAAPAIRPCDLNAPLPRRGSWRTRPSPGAASADP